MTTELVELADRLDRAIDCAQSASRPIHNGGNTHIRETEDYISNFAALRSEAAAIRALASRAGGWLPIESAPKDRSILLLSDGAVVSGKWYGGKSWTTDYDICAYFFDPTHWMEKPAAPEPVGLGMTTGGGSDG